MKRIAVLVLGFCISAWTSGCCCWCHKYYSRYDDGDGSCAQDDYRGNKKKARRAEKQERKRGGRGDRDDDEGVCNSGCNPCCDGGCPTACDGGMMGSGCACGNCGQGMMMNGAPMQSGCASGNCGAQQTYNGQSYNGTPFDPGAGWTIQSTTTQPVGNEPVLAPAIPAAPAPTVAPPRAQGWVPSSAPTPGPVPPVGYNR